MNKKNLIIFFSFLIGFFFQNKTAVTASNIKVSKLDKMINWNDSDNYLEARRTLSLAREINKEKRRRKELRDARLPEYEIQRIIQNERIADKNGMIVNENSKKNIQTENQNLDNENYDTDADDNTDNTYNTDNEIDNSEKLKENKKQSQTTNRIVSEVYRDNYGNNKIASLHEEDKDILIDLSIVPKTPAITTHNDTISSITNNYNDDFELSRMLQKAGENINNSQNFSIFAKEIAKIANKSLRTKETINTPKMAYTQNSNLNFADQTQQSISVNSNYLNEQKYQKNNNTNYKKTNVYNTKLHNIYAIAEQSVENKNNINKINNQKNNFNPYTNNSAKQLNNLNSMLAMTDNNNVVMSEKQMNAKNIGAPYPEKRNNKDRLNQYLPQNISQIAYDKNNKHLEPAVFEKNIIDQVISSIGTDKDNVQTVRALINKLGKIDIADDDGNTILMHAVAKKNQQLISMLLSEGANPNVFNKDGFTPMHLAASNGDNLSSYSLTTNGGDPNLADRNGNTPLMYAAKMCNGNTIKTMISLGGDPTFANKFTGKTAIDFAKENKDSSAVSLLTIVSKKNYGKRKPVNLNQQTL